MMNDFYYESCGSGQIRARKWTPDCHPRGIVQLVHGIAEHAERYDAFAEFLNAQGYLVVAEDHMGHGKSIGEGGVQGYFHGGWFSAVEDSYYLLQLMRKEYPELPYILFGHSMGSFMARTILCKYPHSGITGAVICGTGWQPAALLKVSVPLSKVICRFQDERQPNQMLHTMAFGSYNKRVEHQRTAFDWLTRDNDIVDAYIADPLCGFVESAGLMRDMMSGIAYIQQPDSLANMRMDLPVLFIAGGDDPVGNYGDGVMQAVGAFKSAGMEKVSHRIYPLDRHEILNELNKDEVYADVMKWLESIS